MMPNRPAIIVCVSLLLAIALGAGVAAGADLPGYEHNIRTTDEYLRGVLRAGVASSPALSKLVARIGRSDVVVYLVRDHALSGHLDGETTFLSAAAGRRYLYVKIAWDRLPPRHVATLAHELQHAAEIADAPWVVSSESLAREYERIGFHSPIQAGRRAYESAAARDMGERVWREFVGTAGD